MHKVHSDRGSTVLGTVTATATGIRNIVLNAAGLAVVQGWINNPATNFGFVIQDYDNANKDDLVFSSREATVAANRPHLQVVYTPRNRGPTIITPGGDADGSVNQSRQFDVHGADTGKLTVVAINDYGCTTTIFWSSPLQISRGQPRNNWYLAVASSKNDHRSNDRYDAAADVVLMALGNQLGNPFKILS